MKYRKPRLLKSERDRILIEAIQRVRNAMMLLQGTRVTFGRKAGFLDFQREVLKLTDALKVLGLDPSSPVLHQSIRCDIVVTNTDRRSNNSKPS